MHRIIKWMLFILQNALSGKLVCQQKSSLLHVEKKIKEGFNIKTKQGSILC